MDEQHTSASGGGPTPSRPDPAGVVHGVVAVITRAGRFLLIRRATHLLAGGAWCFVGGAIEQGETQAEALIREFREEVGGRIQPIRKVWHYVRPDGRLHLHWWLAELDGDDLCANPQEVAELRWCSPDEMEQLPNLLDSNREFLHLLGRSLLGG